ncbi:hypothetical protein [Methylobacterium fujisawaense]|uniref:hypothetical protein n=1 Tax=Methylobacterium fujisawaense TaxID=107400 RepID=UPI00313AABBE
MSAWTDTLQATGSLISAGAASVAAIATVVTAFIARRAAGTWRSALREQNADRTIAAGLGLRFALGRLRSAAERENWDAFWNEYGASHKSLSSLEISTSASKRYYRKFPTPPCEMMRTRLADIERTANILARRRTAPRDDNETEAALHGELITKVNQLLDVHNASFGGMMRWFEALI